MKIIEEELIRIKRLIKESETKLSNEEFLKKAPSAIIEKEITKLQDFKDVHKTLLRRLLTSVSDKFNVSDTKVIWLVEYLRERKSLYKSYTEEWFEYVYNPVIDVEELFELLKE